MHKQLLFIFFHRRKKQSISIRRYENSENSSIQRLFLPTEQDGTTLDSWQFLVYLCVCVWGAKVYQELQEH